MRPDTELEQDLPCNLCGSRVTVPWLEAPDTETGEVFRIVKCADCSLAYLSPRPSPQAIGQYYPTTYYSFHAQEGRHGWRDWLRALARASARPQLGGTLTRWVQSVIYVGLKGSFPFIDVPKDGRLLDVGCGTGVWLRICKSYGWDVYGVDLSTQAVETAKASGLLNVWAGTLVEAKFPSNFFDVVTMVQVLEHTYDPRAALLEARRILKPGGRLYVTVPNCASLEARVFASHWRALDVPRHLYFFNPATLRRMMPVHIEWLRSLPNSEFGPSSQIMHDRGVTLSSRMMIWMRYFPRAILCYPLDRLRGTLTTSYMSLLGVKEA